MWSSLTWGVASSVMSPPFADPHGLDVAELLDAVVSELPTAAGGLDPAEGKLRIGGGGAVDEHQARLEPLDELLLLGGAGGQHVGAQPVVGDVGQVEGLPDGAPPVELGDRAEHLFPEQPHVLRYAAEDGRRIEPAGALQGLAAAMQDGALADGVAHLLLD